MEYGLILTMSNAKHASPKIDKYAITSRLFPKTTQVRREKVAVVNNGHECNAWVSI